ncbi:hypothetical protein [Halorientalis regularis]|uniref:hypothetical protein n=1 Tax=Halorientalis regularis TaxID=660518 RepID=UPI001113C80F|nr:hypothetical protein [Halorientalis regularis]
MPTDDSADLSNWIDSPELEGESETYRVLSQWIERHTDASVYWNSSNDLGYDVFRTSDDRIPDLLTVDEYNIVYEVKNADGTATEDGGSDHANDGVLQLIEYWSDYVEGNVKYLIDGKSIEIDRFVLATNMAPFGRLYMAEGNSDVLRTGDGDGRQKAVQHNQVPNNEFNATERAIRLMWRFAEHKQADTDVGIGALLSTRLDEDNPDPTATPRSPVADFEPRVLYKQFKPYDQSWSHL